MIEYAQVMDQIENELMKIRTQLNTLGYFSKPNAIKLRFILERYDGIVEQLYAIDQQLYAQSKINVLFVERKMKLLLDGFSLETKKNSFNISKRCISRSLTNDLFNYQLYQGRNLISGT
jgi:capsule polysaccharide export protein KpsE/RkpR